MSTPPRTLLLVTAGKIHHTAVNETPCKAFQASHLALPPQNGEWVHLDLWWMREMIEIRYGEMDEAEQKRAREGKGKILINHVIQVHPIIIVKQLLLLVIHATSRGAMHPGSPRQHSAVVPDLWHPGTKLTNTAASRPRLRIRCMLAHVLRGDNS